MPATTLHRSDGGSNGLNISNFNLINISHGPGSLEAIIFGPMYAGKTTKLMQRLTMFADVGVPVLYINHIVDDRVTEASDDIVTTHNSQYKGSSHKVDKIKVSVLDSVDISKYSVIGIDEGQFFSDIVGTVRKWVLEEGKHIFIASLDGDSNIRPFGRVHELICLCSPKGLYKLEAKCMNCLSKSLNSDQFSLVPAGFTYKKNTDTSQQDISASQQQDIGGIDKYLAVCLRCHHDLSRSE